MGLQAHMIDSIVPVLQAIWRRFIPPIIEFLQLEPRIYSKYLTFWDALFGVQKGHCFHCQRHMLTYEEAKAIPRKTMHGVHRAVNRATRDHIITMNEQLRKGWHIPLFENTVLACGQCNNKRRDDPMKPDQKARAFEINRAALRAFATETVFDQRHQHRRVMGPYMKNQHEREFKPFRQFPTSQWEYLFKEACRPCARRTHIMPMYFGESAGAAADKLDQRRRIDERRRSGTVQAEA